MLLTTLAPMLGRLNLRLDLSKTKDGRISVTVIPRPSEEGSDSSGEELRPLSLTGTPEELDAELARGPEGALASMVAARRTLSEQIEADIRATKEAAEKKRLEAEQARKKPAPSKKEPSPSAARAIERPVSTAEDEPDDDQDDDTGTATNEPKELW